MGDKFGFAVDFDGNTAVVGAIEHRHVGVSAGAAYTFGLVGTSWVEQSELIGLDTTIGDWFGYAVAVDGDTILVGNRKDDDNGGNSGSAYVFTRQAGKWVQQQKLIASDGQPADLFGSSLALDGDTAAIDATGVSSRTGAVYVFVRSSRSSSPAMARRSMASVGASPSKTTPWPSARSATTTRATDRARPTSSIAVQRAGARMPS